MVQEYWKTLNVLHNHEFSQVLGWSIESDILGVYNLFILQSKIRVSLKYEFYCRWLFEILKVLVLRFFWNNLQLSMISSNTLVNIIMLDCSSLIVLYFILDRSISNILKESIEQIQILMMIMMMMIFWWIAKVLFTFVDM